MQFRLSCPQKAFLQIDGLPGPEKVFKEEFPQAVTARCWFHALRNALAKTPKRLREAMHLGLKKVMYADSMTEAQKAFQDLKMLWEVIVSGPYIVFERTLTR